MFAGAAVADITPGPGLPMGGYGARTGVAEGTADSLCARVLVIADGELTVALVVCDLVGVSKDIVGAVRAQIESDHGIDPGHVCVTATHTHSGPGTLRRKDGAEFVDFVAQRASEAVGSALATRQAVTPRVGRFVAGMVGRNRRHPEGPFARVGVVVRFGEVATLVNFACHATVYEHDNLRYSADFPGAVCRLLERELTGVALYLQGACADVNPLWMRHDAAEVERVGAMVGAAALHAVHETAPAGEGQWVINLSWAEELPVEAPGARLDVGPLAVRREMVELPRKGATDPAALEAELVSLARDPDGESEAERHGRLARRHELEMVKVLAARRLDQAGPEAVEIQAVLLAPGCALIALPGEFFVETGEAITRRAALPHLLVAGYANDYIGYVAPAASHPYGGYEVGVSRFAPEAEALVVDAAVGLLKELA